MNINHPSDIAREACNETHRALLDAVGKEAASEAKVDQLDAELERAKNNAFERRSERVVAAQAHHKALAEYRKALML